MNEDINNLTPKQKELLTLLANGSTPAQAAEQLGIRPASVKNHLLRARERTGIATTYRLVALHYANR